MYCCLKFPLQNYRWLFRSGHESLLQFSFNLYLYLLKIFDVVFHPVKQKKHYLVAFQNILFFSQELNEEITICLSTRNRYMSENRVEFDKKVLMIFVLLGRFFLVYR